MCESGEMTVEGKLGKKFHHDQLGNVTHRSLLGARKCGILMSDCIRPWRRHGLRYSETNRNDENTERRNGNG